MIVIFTLALLAADPDAVLARAAEYVARFSKEFRQYVAGERETQRFYERSGKLRQERTLTADYYYVALPSDPDRAYEFRDILTVDGKTKNRGDRDRLKLLTEPGRDADAERDRLKRESNRYNLFQGSNFLSNIAAGLLAWISTPVQRRALFNFSGTAGEDLVFDFSETGPDTVLREGENRRPLPAAGRFRIAPSGMVRNAEAVIVIHRETHKLRVRYSAEYAANPEGLGLPVRRFIRVTRTDWPAGPVAESMATYGNYRRFGAESLVTAEQ